MHASPSRRSSRMSRRGSQTAAAPARPPRRLTCQPPAPLLSLVEAGVAGVAGAVRAEVGVIMATGEASLGASACHLKWHHKRHLTKLGKSKGGYCSARSWHTQWSVKLPMGNTPLRTEQLAPGVRPFASHGKGAARAGWNRRSSAGGPARCRNVHRNVYRNCVLRQRVKGIRACHEIVQAPTSNAETA